MRSRTICSILATPSSASAHSMKWKSLADPAPTPASARVDAVGVDDDAALGRLPEHFGQPHHRHGTGGDDVGEDLAGADGGS